MRNVHREQVEQVMGEFVEVVGDQTSLGVGADGYIRKMLTQALGEDKANNLIDRILLGGSISGLDSLKWMEPRAVADAIRDEHPQIQAIVVAYLDPDQAAEVLSHLDHKVRPDIVLRVSSLNTVQPSALKELQPDPPRSSSPAIPTPPAPPWAGSSARRTPRTTSTAPSKAS
ncbi:hypothetical protein P4110_10345 [Pseudomonas aeruginosa]|nr:hypothetical protein [Pseudomonas aeruginosa]